MADAEENEGLAPLASLTKKPLIQAPRRGRRQSTNDFIRGVLDNAVRQQWVGQKKVTSKQRAHGRRMSNLYGVNISHKIVKKRVKRGERRPSSPTKDCSDISGKPVPGGSVYNRSLGRRRATASLASMGGGGGGGGGAGGKPPRVPGSPGAALDRQDSMESLSANLPKGIREEVAAHERRRQLELTERGMLGPLSSVASLRSTGGAGAGGAAGHGFYPSSSLRSTGARSLGRRRGRGSQTGGGLGGGDKKPSTPWYCGRTNTVTCPPSSPFARAARYGFTGSQKLDAASHYKSTSSLEAWQPGFLKQASGYNEYAEPLHTSPSLWPSGSRYVCGSRLKKMQPRKEMTPRIRRWFDRGSTERGRLNDSVVMEKRSLHRSVRRARSTGALSKLNATVGKGGSVYQQKRNVVTEDQNRMRYWNSFTVIYARKENAQTIKEELEKARRDREMRMHLKWREIVYLHKLMRMPQYRRPGMEDFDELLKALAQRADERRMGVPGQAGGYTLICRDDFTAAVQSAYEIASMKHVNRLFSGFDLDRKDEADVRSVLGTLRVEWKAQESAADKLDALFRIWDLHGVLADKRRKELGGFDGQTSASEAHEAASQRSGSKAGSHAGAKSRGRAPASMGGASQGSVLADGEPRRLHRDDLLQLLLTCAVTEDEIAAMDRVFRLVFQPQFTCEEEGMPDYMRKHAKREHLTYEAFCISVQANAGNIVDIFEEQVGQRIPNYQPPAKPRAATAASRRSAASGGSAGLGTARTGTAGTQLTARSGGLGTARSGASRSVAGSHYGE